MRIKMLWNELAVAQLQRKTIECILYSIEIVATDRMRTNAYECVCFVTDLSSCHLRSLFICVLFFDLCAAAWVYVQQWYYVIATEAVNLKWIAFSFSGIQWLDECSGNYYITFIDGFWHVKHKTLFFNWNRCPMRSFWRASFEISGRLDKQVVKQLGEWLGKGN